MAMGKAICFHDEPWQLCNLFLMCFFWEWGGGRGIQCGFISFTAHPTNSLFSSFNLVARAEGHWIMHAWGSVMHLHFCSDKTRGGELLPCQYIHFGRALAWKRFASKRQPIKIFPFFFHARSLREALSCCRFQSRLCRPTEPGRIWGHRRAGRCGLIRRTLHFIKARNHTDFLPSGLAHYCDTTCTQSITQATDSGDLISTPWSHWFFPTDCIPMPLSAQEIYHVPPPHNKQRLVQEVKWTHFGVFSCLLNADMGTHAIFSLVRQCVNCSSRKKKKKKKLQRNY